MDLFFVHQPGESALMNFEMLNFLEKLTTTYTHQFASLGLAQVSGSEIAVACGGPPNLSASLLLAPVRLTVSIVR